MRLSAARWCHSWSSGTCWAEISLRSILLPCPSRRPFCDFVLGDAEPKRIPFPRSNSPQQVLAESGGNSLSLLFDTDILQKKQVESPTPFFQWLQKKEPDDRMDHPTLALLFLFILFFPDCLCAQRIQGLRRMNAAGCSLCSWRLIVSLCSLWSWEASQMKSQVWKEAGPGLSPPPGFLWTNTYC